MECLAGYLQKVDWQLVAITVILVGICLVPLISLKNDLWPKSTQSK